MLSANALVRLLVLLCALLLIVIGVMWHANVADEPAYVIGSPVLPSSMLPVGMALKTYEVPEGAPAPTVAFTIVQDSMGGWDVHATTTNFAITPEHLNGAPVPGEGHLHLYVDNNLIIMLGDWYHIDSLMPGTHTIRVGLFNNDHSAYAVGGKQIEAVQEITVPMNPPQENSMQGMSM